MLIHHAKARGEYAVEHPWACTLSTKAAGSSQT
jgi:hypothetical protein